MTTITIDRAVVEQALEALENTSPLGFNMESDKKFFAALTALRAALAQEQAEPVEPVATLTAQRDALLEALKEMLEYAGIIEERCDTVATNKARAAIVRANLTKGAADD